jgi:hypothetical protein
MLDWEHSVTRFWWSYCLTSFHFHDATIPGYWAMSWNVGNSFITRSGPTSQKAWLFNSSSEETSCLCTWFGFGYPEATFYISWNSRLDFLSLSTFYNPLVNVCWKRITKFWSVRKSLYVFISLNTHSNETDDQRILLGWLNLHCCGWFMKIW